MTRLTKEKLRTLIIEVMSERNHPMSAYEVCQACRTKSSEFRSRFSSPRSIVQHMRPIAEKSTVQYSDNLVIWRYVLRKEYKPKR